MKRPLPTRCALALLVMAPTWPLCAQNQDAAGGDSGYQHFMLYPHRQAGYAALRAGNERNAIAEFMRARELAPQSVDTALDLVEAYRSNEFKAVVNAKFQGYAKPSFLQ